MSTLIYIASCELLSEITSNLGRLTTVVSLNLTDGNINDFPVSIVLKRMEITRCAQTEFTQSNWQAESDISLQKVQAVNLVKIARRFS